MTHTIVDGFDITEGIERFNKKWKEGTDPEFKKKAHKLIEATYNQGFIDILNILMITQLDRIILTDNPIKSIEVNIKLHLIIGILIGLETPKEPNG